MLQSFIMKYIFNSVFLGYNHNGLAVLFSSQLINEVQQLMNSDSTIRFRIYEVIYFTFLQFYKLKLCFYKAHK